MKSNKYKEKMMIILILILIIAIISGVFLFVYIHSVSKVLEKIRNQLENAILGEYTIIDYNDGYESAIGEEVNKLLSIFQDQRKKQKKEQKNYAAVSCRCFSSDKNTTFEYNCLFGISG